MESPRIPLPVIPASDAPLETSSPLSPPPEDIESRIEIEIDSLFDLEIIDDFPQLALPAVPLQPQENLSVTLLEMSVPLQKYQAVSRGGKGRDNIAKFFSSDEETLSPRDKREQLKGSKSNIYSLFGEDNVPPPTEDVVVAAPISPRLKEHVGFILPKRDRVLHADSPGDLDDFQDDFPFNPNQPHEPITTRMGKIHRAVPFSLGEPELDLVPVPVVDRPDPMFTTNRIVSNDSSEFTTNSRMLSGGRRGKTKAVIIDKSELSSALAGQT